MVTLGTPLGPHATRVVLLGAGELAKEVLVSLQRLGVETVAVDRYGHAPGHQVAHTARTAVMADPAALRAVVTEELARRPGSPLVLVPEIEALATEVLVELEEAGLMTVVPTARAARLTMDREGIRRLAAEDLGLPTSGYRFCDSLEELRAAAEELGFPCLVKPVTSSSGKGQSTLRGPDDAGPAWEHALAGGRVARGRVIVESFVDFDAEITLLTVRSAGPDGSTTTSFCAPVGHRQVDGDYVESWQPHALAPAALARAQEVAAAVTGDLGGWGVFGVELFLRGDRVWFSEVSPRPHDTGLVTLATQHQSQFDLHARALLGLPVDTSLRSAGASAVVRGSATGAGVVFDGVDAALAVPGTDLRLFGKPTTHPGRRLGVALARALDGEVPGDVAGPRERAARAASLVVPRLP